MPFLVGEFYFLDGLHGGGLVLEGAGGKGGAAGVCDAGLEDAEGGHDVVFVGGDLFFQEVAVFLE